MLLGYKKSHPSSTCAERCCSGRHLGLQAEINKLKQLHWLPVEWRIKFKIACITYKTISTTQPAYVC